MPRAQSQDQLQANNFWLDAVLANESKATLLDETDTDAQGGFNQVTTPDVSADAVEYRTGTSRHTIKQPGIESYGNVTCQKGVTRRSSALFDWMKRAHIGQEYRANVTIYHFPRSVRDANGIDAAKNKDKAKKTECFECFPTRCKPDGDFDGTSAEILMTELEFALEYFDVTLPAA